MLQDSNYCGKLYNDPSERRGLRETLINNLHVLVSQISGKPPRFIWMAGARWPGNYVHQTT